MYNFKKNKALRVMFLFLYFIILVTGCGREEAKQPTAGGYTVVDYQGTSVYIPRKPHKIMAYSLGFDVMTLGVVEPSRLVSVNYLDEVPEISPIVEKTKNIQPKIKTYSAEEVTKLKPDLIIASTWAKPEMIKTCRDFGIPVVVCKGPVNVAEVEDAMTLIATAVDEKERGQQVLNEMHRQLKEIKDVLSKRTDKKPCGLLISMMTSYGGRGSMYDSLCNEARVENGIAKVGLKNGEYLSKELVVAADPDFFIVSKPWSSGKYGYEDFKDQFLQDPALKGMRGLNNLIIVPDRYLYSASQQCVYAIKALANYAYGPIFDIKNEKLIKGY